MSAIENIEKQLSFAESMNLEQYDSINPNWITDLVACLKVELSDLKREIEQDKRDALRYRHLRDETEACDWEFIGHQSVDQTDKLIDAAIAAKKDGV